MKEQEYILYYVQFPPVQPFVIVADIIHRKHVADKFCCGAKLASN